ASPWRTDSAVAKERQGRESHPKILAVLQSGQWDIL
ncbi:unnamed protein product, partial [marine sediment metagenome]